MSKEFQEFMSKPCKHTTISIYTASTKLQRVDCLVIHEHRKETTWSIKNHIMEIDDMIQELEAAKQHNRKQLRLLPYLEPTDREVKMWGTGAEED